MRQQCPRIMPCFRVHATFLLILRCLCNLVPIFAQVHRPLSIVAEVSCSLGCTALLRQALEATLCGPF